MTALKTECMLPLWLSVTHARGAQYIRRTSELAVHRLDGFLPVAEDWHAKLCLLEVLLLLLFVRPTTIIMHIINIFHYRYFGRGL